MMGWTQEDTKKGAFSGQVGGPDQPMDRGKMYNCFDMIMDVITGSTGPEAVMRLLD